LSACLAGALRLADPARLRWVLQCRTGWQPGRQQSFRCPRPVDVPLAPAKQVAHLVAVSGASLVVAQRWAELLGSSAGHEGRAQV